MPSSMAQTAFSKRLAAQNARQKVKSNPKSYETYAGGASEAPPTLSSEAQLLDRAFSSATFRAISVAIFVIQACSKMPPEEPCWPRNRSESDRDRSGLARSGKLCMRGRCWRLGRFSGRSGRSGRFSCSSTFSRGGSTIEARGVGSRSSCT